MARFADYQPMFRIVDAGGNLLEGPYRMDVPFAQPTLGIVLGETEPWYEDENVGPYLNFQWNEIAYNLGYRYYVRLNFAQVEAAPANNKYGLSLLDYLYQTAVQNQVTFAALQFSLFMGGPFFGVRSSGSGGFHPMKTGGKQGFYELSLTFKSRELQASPKPWAASTW